MNISTVSFGSGNNQQINIPSFMYEKNNRIQSENTSLERTPKDDQFRKQTITNHKTNKNNSPIKKSKKRTIIPMPIKTFTAGIAAALLLNTGVSTLSKPESAVTIPFDNTVSITEIADTYNIEEDALLSYNGITEETDLNDLSELIIPSSFDYLQDKIDSLQEKLYDSGLSDEERDEIVNQIEQYSEKQEYQQNIALVYTDGDYVYYELKEITEDAPEEIYEQFKNGINVEIFKDIFDIKDGAIRKNNDLSYTFTSVGPEDDPEHYLDYSGNTLRAGRVIKVPVSAVKTSNITLDY